MFTTWCTTLLQLRLLGTSRTNQNFKVVMTLNESSDNHQSNLSSSFTNVCTQFHGNLCNGGGHFSFSSCKSICLVITIYSIFSHSRTDPKPNNSVASTHSLQLSPKHFCSRCLPTCTQTCARKGHFIYSVYYKNCDTVFVKHFNMAF